MALTPQKPTRKYNSTQAELYEVCKLGVKSFEENLAEFTNWKAFYTQQWANDFKQEIEDAENLPSFQARDEPSETAHVLLVKKAEECLKAWKRLSSHIRDVEDWEELQKSKQEAAGSLRYPRAANFNWDELTQLMKDGDIFIQANLSDLTANQNMPNPFAGQFATLRTEINQLFEDFGDKEQDQEEDTAEKINANNVLHTTLMKMFEDGTEIFSDDRAKQERFFFSHVLELVRGSKGKNKTFAIPASDRLVVSRVVANSDITNTGTVTLWVALGDVETQPLSATQLDPEATITRPEKGETLTIFNNDPTTEGLISIRVTVD